MDMLYTIALYDTGMLIATVPEGADIEVAIKREEENIWDNFDRVRIIINHYVTLTDEPEDDDQILYSGSSMGFLMDENGRVYQYAVRRG